jgi:hypothetical protein
MKEHGLAVTLPFPQKVPDHPSLGRGVIGMVCVVNLEEEFGKSLTGMKGHVLPVTGLSKRGNDLRLRESVEFGQFGNPDKRSGVVPAQCCRSGSV